tara:strand:+ start:338 stop:1036 length:699 start_codon:yes stop_codon:yes gene_type:complete
MIEITIIIPVYNEIKTIENLLSKVIDLEIKKQIIVIDDGSIDGTREYLLNNENKIDKLIFHEKNLGKGACIQSAQRYVNGKYTAIQDADLEYDPKDLKKIIEFMKKNNKDVVYGSRVLGKNKFENTKNFTHFIRIWGNIFLTSISNFINKQKLTDAHTCYKVIKSEIFKKIKLVEKRFAFCPEITTKLAKANYYITEVPVNYSGRTYSDGKKISSIDGLVALYCLFKYRFFS